MSAQLRKLNAASMEAWLWVAAGELPHLFTALIARPRVRCEPLCVPRLAVINLKAGLVTVDADKEPVGAKTGTGVDLPWMSLARIVPRRACPAQDPCFDGAACAAESARLALNSESQIKSSQRFLGGDPLRIKSSHTVMVAINAIRF